MGIKPTVGLISRAGIIPISFTQDTPGPMARTVRDAAICLGALTGIDSSDEKSLDSKGKSYEDYTQFLNPDGLAKKRIGFYLKPRGRNHRVDHLMERAVQFIRDHGAEIVEIERLGQEDIGSMSFQVMLYEFKDGLNKYFDSLGPLSPVNSLEHLIEITFADSIEMQYFDHALLKRAQEKGGLEEAEYQEALRSMLQSARQEGLDKIMQENALDAIVAPTGGPAWKTDLINGDRFGVSSAGPAAWAGYPNITLPMGFIDGLPVGISFFGRAWSEPRLLEMAYAFELGTKHRKPPDFHTPQNSHSTASP